MLPCLDPGPLCLGFAPQTMVVRFEIQFSYKAKDYFFCPLVSALRFVLHREQREGPRLGWTRPWRSTEGRVCCPGQEVRRAPGEQHLLVCSEHAQWCLLRGCVHRPAPQCFTCGIHHGYTPSMTHPHQPRTAAWNRGGAWLDPLQSGRLIPCAAAASTARAEIQLSDLSSPLKPGHALSRRP